MISPWSLDMAGTNQERLEDEEEADYSSGV
jgi:hypothetical protein